MGKVSIIGIFVGDLIIACSLSKEVKSIIAFLKELFSNNELENVEKVENQKIDCALL
jgi:hypothetical protein